MAYANYAVYGAGFVLYDEYNPVTKTCTNTVKEFLNKFLKDKDPTINLENIFYPDYLHDKLDVCEFYDRTNTGADGTVFVSSDSDNRSHFYGINGNIVEPVTMLVVRCHFAPSIYNAPFKTKHEFVSFMRKELDRIGFTKFLPENFDMESHIGTFDTVETTI